VAVHPEDLGDMDGVDDNGVSNGHNLFRSGGSIGLRQSLERVAMVNMDKLLPCLERL